jgi:hypothetical protein
MGCRAVASQALQPRKRQNGAVDLALRHLAQPCVDIAPEHDDRDVRSHPLDQRLPAQRRGADDGTPRQFLDCRGRASDEGVARVLTWQEGRQFQSIRQRGWHILRGMHGEIDPAVEERFLDLLGKSPLPPASDKGRSWIRSPLVVMISIAKALSGRSCARIRRARVSAACASARRCRAFRS